MKDRIWSVGELIRAVNTLLDQGFSGVTVEGEVSGVTTSARGHIYFTLKDEAAQVDCVMWAGKAKKLKFRTEAGLLVLATGSLTVYPQRGRFQMVVDELQPQGVGALQLAFEQLKERLAAEGLFASERKRELPALPNRVGIVTSATGAALQDMLNVLRRFPHLEVVVAPSRVQGDEAGEEIASAIERLVASDLVNLVIVGRGGGSLEDLWAFNEEVVARAIAACPVPVISGVGHEVDFTIADFVADIRATTPTQAAEIVVARLEAQERRTNDGAASLRHALRRHLDLSRARLHGLEGSSGLARLPQRLRLLAARLDRADRLPQLLEHLVERVRARLDRAAGGLRRLPARVAAGGHRRLLSSRQEQIKQLMLGRLNRLHALVAADQRALDHLSPRKVLERGYSITTVEGAGRPLKRAADARAGDTLRTTLADGSLRSVVGGSVRRRKSTAETTTEQPSLFDEPDNNDPDDRSTR